tara:strand:+ start:4616 stop:4810 length:195 start_codon:yes stop_codon:yes gene_type:complete
MKTLKTITFGKVELRLDQVSSKEDNRILGYMISKFQDGLRYYLSSPTNIKETKEHFDFYVNVYK